MKEEAFSSAKGRDQEIEELQEKIANKLGYKLRGHRLELFGVPLKKDKK